MRNAILIIAAGSSSRLGKAKQLLPYKGDILLNHIIKESLSSGQGDVYLVLGSRADKIEDKLCEGDFKIIKNPKWSEGMSTSIAYGVQNLQRDIQYDGVYIVLGDQVYFTGTILKKIYKTILEINKSDSIIVSQYKDGKGPPSYFSKHYFSELAKLKGDDGAKSIVKKNKDSVNYVNFELGDIDIDLEEDLKHLL